MKNFKIMGLMLAIAGISLFTSCKKDRANNSEETELAIEIQSNNAEATKVYDIINNEIDDASALIDSLNYVNPTKTLDSCVTITINHPDTTTWPKIIIYDFSGNCTTENGNVLSGQIVINQTDRYRNDGMVRTITFNGFAINGYMVTGTKTITNLGTISGFKTFSVSIVDGAITTPTGEVIVTRNAQRVRSWIEGESTHQKYDDVYLITGTTSGPTRNGKVFSSTITEPLLVAKNCRWIKRGKITTTIENGPVVLIDFGNGDCDRIATITINGNTRTVNMRN
ncbi:MAG: hypothetical protein WCP69_02545 [Bacteroidota bacterium]